MGTLQAQALSFLDTALRVPPLFVMDEVLKSCFGFSNNIHARYSKFIGDDNPFLNDEGFGLQEEELKQWATSNDTDAATEEDPNLLSSVAPATVKIIMFILVYKAATVSFLLSSHHLMKVYLMLGSLGTVIASYQLNLSLLNSLLLSTSSSIFQAGPGVVLLVELFRTVWLVGSYSLLELCLAYLFMLLQGTQSTWVKRLIMASFVLPSIGMAYDASSSVAGKMPVLGVVVPLSVVQYHLVCSAVGAARVIIDGYLYARRVMRDFGLHTLLESEWVRLNVPNVLRTFWLLRASHHLANLLAELMLARGEHHPPWGLGIHDAYVVFKTVMTQGCETAVALLGMTSVVSWISHQVGAAFQALLLTTDDDDRSMGTVCAILFFILAEQSGLTVMEADKRFVRLCRNFCLLFTAMLHFVHNMVNPVLMSLSASRNPVLYRHVRALLVCALLVLLPLALLSFLWSYYPLSTWLLAVSAFSIQVEVKTLVSVLIYGLFLVDAYRTTFWERLDDYVYYIRAFGNSVEFVFGILLFFNGAWIYFFESGGSIRALMMCIHAYFNIWCEARNGWTVFMKRRTAVNKINSLPEATETQLACHNDVCAICFQGLQSAKITKCNHYFHSVCLRKWLYVQDSCPLCHETLYKVETPPEEPHPQGEMVWDLVMEQEQQEEVQQRQERQDYNNVRGEEQHMWDQQEIEVILGENMNGPELVVDSEVGEVLSRKEGAGAVQDPELGPLMQDVDDNNPQATLRSRRGRGQVTDQDVGQ